MAKITRKLVEAFKEEAAKTVISMETGEQPKSKGGVFTTEDINSIKDEVTRKEIQSRYDAYVDAAKASNDIRHRMSEAKYNLQNALDGPFTRLELISKSRCWNILGLDEIESIIYRDSERNYKLSYERHKDRKQGRGSATVKDRGTEWDKAWDMANEDIPALDQDTSQDILDQFLTLTDSEQLDVYVGLTPEQQVSVFTKLGEKRKAFFDTLDDAHKERVKHLLTGSKTLSGLRVRT
jgi:hypothetical protein